MKMLLIICWFSLMLPTATDAEELGRLFFTPEQRAQLDYIYGRDVRPDDNALTLNGIVQMHGGKRTAWINGVPQAAGRSDEMTPESALVPVPGKNKSIKLKVGQRILLNPSASTDATNSNMPVKTDIPNQDATEP